MKGLHSKFLVAFLLTSAVVLSWSEYFLLIKPFAKALLFGCKWATLWIQASKKVFSVPRDGTTGLLITGQTCYHYTNEELVFIDRPAADKIQTVRFELNEFSDTYCHVLTPRNTYRHILKTKDQMAQQQQQQQQQQQKIAKLKSARATSA